MGLHPHLAGAEPPLLLPRGPGGSLGVLRALPACSPRSPISSGCAGLTPWQRRAGVLGGLGGSLLLPRHAGLSPGVLGLGSRGVLGCLGGVSLLAAHIPLSHLSPWCHQLRVLGSPLPPGHAGLSSGAPGSGSKGSQGFRGSLTAVTPGTPGPLTAPLALQPLRKARTGEWGGPTTKPLSGSGQAAPPAAVCPRPRHPLVPAGTPQLPRSPRVARRSPPPAPGRRGTRRCCTPRS